jgi:soluble lytic murein transglycosylase
MGFARKFDGWTGPERRRPLHGGLARVVLCAVFLPAWHAVAVAQSHASKTHASKAAAHAAGAVHGHTSKLAGHAAAKSKPTAHSARAQAKSTKSAKGTKSGKRRAGKTAVAEERSSQGSTKAKHHGVEETEASRRLTTAFIASAQLRPMAQQLAAHRAPGAYAGVLGYAQSHPGDGAATAYLALGHAYALDRRYADAAAAFRMANQQGDVLDDYADYLGAQASLQAGHGADAYSLLNQFAARHPDSIFVANAPVLLANAYLQQNDVQGALATLRPLDGSAQSSHSDFLYTLGRAYQISGDTTQAAAVYRKLYTTLPLSSEAAQARNQLQVMNVGLTAAERKVHADKLFDAKRYIDASNEYHALAQNDSTLSPGDRDALQIYAAVCDLKLKRLKRPEAERLPVTSDDSAALKLYLLAELARSEDDRASNAGLVQDLVAKYPGSRWTEEALYSSGNMYLLKHEAPQAIDAYASLVRLFPNSTYAPSAHWREAWQSYRLRRYADAERLMDEQIQRYRGGIEIPNALYWRGRLYEEEEHNFPQAANFYRALSRTYVNFYYAEMARQRLAVLGVQPAVQPASMLSGVHAPAIPDLTDAIPQNDPHLIKAKLLANAALNEYIGPEIQAGAGSAQWGALAQAQIYASYGELTRALQSMKHSGIGFFSLPESEVPEEYWQLLFPRPYWNDLVQRANQNGLDPFLVASLIRQESEFNAGAVSPANAYGLMQLIPSTGKQMAKRQGIKHFKTNELLNPEINLQLGTANLREVIDRFGGRVEYALAAYNAGDGPIRQWLASGDYKDVVEFVESIPYTETREYVQAILRNREMYRTVYGGGHAPAQVPKPNQTEQYQLP